MSTIVSTRTIGLIWAQSPEGVVGFENTIPWRVPEDMANFRTVTWGHPVIMGRKTWDSLPERFRPLPGRQNIVVTRQAGWSAAGATAVPGLAEARAAAGAAPRVFVIGGAELYAQALPEADELVLTEIDLDVDGDTHFPAWDRLRFTEAARDHHTSSQGLGFSFVRYLRK